MIIDGDGKEVKEYEKPGELVVQSPAVTLGYFNNERATMETFVHDDEGRWIRTGDEVCVRKAPSGFEHLVILDRIKELIKVKVILFKIPETSNLLTILRVIKLHRPNWKLIFSLILPSQIARS